MSARFLIMLGVLFTPLLKAQQTPVFKNKEDSSAYAILDAKLDARFRQAVGNQKLIDSIMTARSTFLNAHEHLWRFRFRQDPAYTLYQSLKSIANKDSITKISILGKGRSRLPDSLRMYRNLAELELIDFKISKFQKKSLMHLKKLSIYNNFPQKNLRLPKNSSITMLTIRGDERGKLPKSYKNFRNLTSLTLSRNNLREFPNAKMPASIERIDLSFNSLTTVPGSVGKLTKLRALNFNNNNISRVEPGIENLKALEELSFYKNNLREIPSMLYTMTSLRVIDLYYNHIPRVSAEIGNWKNLEILYLANNELFTIPDEIGQLTKLKELYLHHNRLSTLPESIGNLRDVNILRINHNNMIEWPVGLNNLRQLGNFDCSSNQLESIPISELDFRNMKILSLGGNPWNPEVRKNIDVWIRVLRENDVVVHIDRPRP